MLQYKDWDSSSKDSVIASRRDDLVEFLSDAFYVAPITELALMHAASPQSSINTFYFVLNCTAGATSTDMLAYSLGAAMTDGIDPFATDVVYSATDKLLSEIVLTYWNNFITTGSVIVALHSSSYVRLSHQ